MTYKRQGRRLQHLLSTSPSSKSRHHRSRNRIRPRLLRTPRPVLLRQQSARLQAKQCARCRAASFSSLCSSPGSYSRLQRCVACALFFAKIDSPPVPVKHFWLLLTENSVGFRSRVNPRPCLPSSRQLKYRPKFRNSTANYSSATEYSATLPFCTWMAWFGWSHKFL